jgi:GNAT superfamily N-acetyltransferase
MASRIGEDELRRRAFDGLTAEIEWFGGAPESSVIRREGLIAAISPRTPERSIFNSVSCDGPKPLEATADELGEAYDAAGVRAWTVWVHDRDRRSADFLAGRGHVLDAAPRAMALDLRDLSSPPAAPMGLELAPCDPDTAAQLNDRAYGYERPAFRAIMEEGSAVSLRLLGAFEDGDTRACVGTIDVGDDCVVTGVATPPEYQRRGIASWTLHATLAEAHERGLATGSLQASRAGAPLYERLGFRDFGFLEIGNCGGGDEVAHHRDLSGRRAAMRSACKAGIPRASRRCPLRDEEEQRRFALSPRLPSRESGRLDCRDGDS